MTKNILNFNLIMYNWNKTLFQTRPGERNRKNIVTLRLKSGSVFQKVVICSFYHYGNIRGSSRRMENWKPLICKNNCSWDVTGNFYDILCYKFLWTF